MRVCLVAAAIAVVADPALAQRRIESVTPRDLHNASLSGRIALPSGFPAGIGLKVTLKTSSTTIGVIFSDRNGEFEFPNLRGGDYVVEIADGTGRFDTLESRVQVIPGTRSTVTLNLREKNFRERGVASAPELDARVPGSARKEYERAHKLLKKGKSDEAIRALERAVEIHPEFQKARNDLGVQYVRAGRPGDAASQFEEAIRIDPDAFNPRLNLGSLLVDRGEYARATGELARAVEIDATQPAAHLFLGMAQLKTSQLAPAKDSFRKALVFGEGVPRFAVASYYLGVIHAKLGERSEAAGCLRTFLETASDGPLADHARSILAQLQ